MNIINTQNAAQFAINSFHRVEIPIGSSSAKPFNGQYFPEVEGTGIFVERCDFPFLFTFNTQKGSNNQSITLKDGNWIETPFKGFTISLPDSVFALAANSTISLIVCKNGARYENQIATPNTRLGPSARTVSNTALSQVIGIYVPPGVRELDNVYMSVPFTTLATINATFLDAANNQLIGPSATQTFNGAQVGYGGVPFVPFTISGGIGFNPKLIIPTQCVEIQLTATGTGLGAPLVYGNFA